jgi:hypothetical protein
MTREAAAAQGPGAPARQLYRASLVTNVEAHRVVELSFAQPIRRTPTPEKARPGGSYSRRRMFSRNFAARPRRIGTDVVDHDGNGHRRSRRCVLAEGPRSPTERESEHDGQSDERDVI